MLQLNPQFFQAFMLWEGQCQEMWAVKQRTVGGVLTERLEQAIYFINLLLRVAPNSSSGGRVEGDPENEITTSSFCSENASIRVDTVSSLMYKKNIITSPGCYYFHVNKQNFELWVVVLVGDKNTFVCIKEKLNRYGFKKSTFILWFFLYLRLFRITRDLRHQRRFRIWGFSLTSIKPLP